MELLKKYRDLLVEYNDLIKKYSKTLNEYAKVRKEYLELQKAHLKLLSVGHVCDLPKEGDKLLSSPETGPEPMIKNVIRICESSSRGVFKRIDENRELFETIQREAPDLLNRCPWVAGWIATNDQFFVELSEAVNVENIFDQEKYGHFRQYPRPWPDKK